MRMFTQTPLLFLVLGVVVFSGLAALVIWIGVESDQSVILRVGAGFAGLALLYVLILLLRALMSLAKKSRELGDVYRRNRKQLRPYLIGGGAIFSFLLLLISHNYVVWHGVERDCALALESGDTAAGKEAYARGKATMKSPLLIMPSRLLDLWGPNRCRSAERRWELGATGELDGG
jgi:hypothetical protein